MKEELKKAIEDHTSAVTYHIEALRNEIVAKDLSKKTYYALQLAKRNMEDKIKESMEQIERFNDKNK